MAFMSLYGTDGCGKSTIARKIASGVPETSRAVVMGGSSYKEWLTPEMAKEFMGGKHQFGEPIHGPDDETRLYEDIAIVCYGLANKLAMEGRLVVIDSDPYLKRVIWGTLHNEGEAATKYVENFSNRMSDFLDQSIAPQLIVGMNVAPRSEISNEQLLARLALRGDNSEHDPSSVEAISTLDSHVRYIWSEIALARSGSHLSQAFDYRLRNAELAEYENPQCSPDQVLTQAEAIAGEIITDHLLRG